MAISSLGLVGHLKMHQSGEMGVCLTASNVLTETSGKENTVNQRTESVMGVGSLKRGSEPMSSFSLVVRVLA